MAHAIAAWIAFFAFYLLFAGTVEPAKLAAGGACAGLAAVFEAALRAHNERPLDLTLPMLRPLAPASGQLVLDTFRVGAALLAAFRRPPSGRFRTVAVPHGTAAEAPAGRGIAVAAASLAPNSFVVGDGPERGRMLVHQLAD
ncbi:MAG: hypothetical protein WA184_14360 [Stellaceae bacterium]